MFVFFSSDKSAFDETEKSLKALIKMAANPECIPSLIEGLGNYMKLVLTLTDQADTPTIEAAITQLFSQCIQVRPMTSRFPICQ